MKTFLRVLLIALLLALVFLMVPSSIPLILAEDLPLPEWQQPVLEMTADDVEDIPRGAETPYAPRAKGYSHNGMDYNDPSISVHSEIVRRYETDILLTYITIADPTQFRCAPAVSFKSKQTRTVEYIAKREKAVVAINGDNFLNNSGPPPYAVRNGETFRALFDKYNPENYDALVIDSAGDLHIVQGVTAENVGALQAELAEQDRTIVHAYSFGPGIIVNGEKCPEERLHVLHYASRKCAQRICLAQTGPLSYLVVATAGPQNRGSKGLTLPQFQNVLFELGVQQAYNLDGGSSSSVVMNNVKVNTFNNKKKRDVGDAIFFITGVKK